MLLVMIFGVILLGYRLLGRSQTDTKQRRIRKDRECADPPAPFTKSAAI